MESSHFTIRVEESGIDRVVFLSGELDVAGAVHLGATIDSLVESQPTALTVDLAGLTFIDSSGLTALIDLRTRLADCPVSLSQPSSAARRLFKLTGLTDFLSVVDDNGGTENDEIAPT